MPTESIEEGAQEGQHEALRFSELIDLEKTRRLLEDFHAATGFVVGIVDTDGEILVQIGYRSICTEFHRGHPESETRCIQSDLHIASELEKGDYTCYTCANGLIDAASPIIIDGEHLATIFTGQFFFERPEESFFDKQAIELGFDRIRYFEALSEVPVVSREQYHSVMGFLTKFAVMLAELGLAMKRQREAEAAMLQAQKMEAIGRLAGGVAHDVNNMLQAVVGYGWELREELTGDRQLTSLAAHIIEAGDKAARVVSQLLAFSRRETLNPKPVSLPALVEESVALFDPLIGEHIEVELNLAPEGFSTPNWVRFPSAQPLHRYSHGEESA